MEYSWGEEAKWQDVLLRGQRPSRVYDAGGRGMVMTSYRVGFLRWLHPAWMVGELPLDAFDAVRVKER
jgi:hypothetical protein